MLHISHETNDNLARLRNHHPLLESGKKSLSNTIGFGKGYVSNKVIKEKSYSLVKGLSLVRRKREWEKLRSRDKEGVL